MAKLATLQHIYIYIYACCRVKTWSTMWGFLSQNLVQDCVKTWSKIFLCLFSPNFKVFWGIFKNTNSVQGCENIFRQFVRVSKKGFRKQNVHFCFCLFYVGERKREKMKKKNGNENFKTIAQKKVFWGVGCEQQMFFAEMAFSEKQANTSCVRKEKKPRIFVATICFWKMLIFCAHSKSPNTTKIWASAGTGETQNGAFGCKSAILGRGRKRGFTICDT